MNWLIYLRRYSTKIWVEIRELKTLIPFNFTLYRISEYSAKGALSESVNNIILTLFFIRKV